MDLQIKNIKLEEELKEIYQINEDLIDDLNICKEGLHLIFDEILLSGN